MCLDLVDLARIENLWRPRRQETWCFQDKIQTRGLRSGLENNIPKSSVLCWTTRSPPQAQTKARSLHFIQLLTTQGAHKVRAPERNTHGTELLP